MAEEKKEEAQKSAEKQSQDSAKKQAAPESQPKRKDNKPKFSFNIYWVYVVIAMTFIGMTFLPSITDDTRKLNQTTFKELVTDKDVERVVVVNKEVAEVYLRKEALEQGETRSPQGKSGFDEQWQWCSLHLSDR
jgi:hypothetical protein